MQSVRTRRVRSSKSHSACAIAFTSTLQRGRVSSVCTPAGVELFLWYMGIFFSRTMSSILVRFCLGKLCLFSQRESPAAPQPVVVLSTQARPPTYRLGFRSPRTRPNMAHAQGGPSSTAVHAQCTGQQPYRRASSPAFFLSAWPSNNRIRAIIAPLLCVFFVCCNGRM